MKKRLALVVAGLRRPVLTLPLILGAVAALTVSGSSWAASPATPGAAASALTAAASAASTPRTPPQRRQFAVTTLSRFKVVLTATRVSRFDASVTAAGYRHTSHGWKLIATKQIGKSGSWSWFATDVCSLKVAQLTPEPSSAKPTDSITVNLLWGPAIGCLGPYTKHWKP